MIRKSNLRESENRPLQETDHYRKLKTKDNKQIKSRRFGEPFSGAFAFTKAMWEVCTGRKGIQGHISTWGKES